MKLLADSVQGVIGQITPPQEIQPLTSRGGAGGINFILETAVKLIFAFGAVAVVFMLLIGGVEWIISGGEKEKVAQAQKRITWALIGVALLATTFVILTIVGKILGFTIVNPIFKCLGDADFC